LFGLPIDILFGLYNARGQIYDQIAATRELAGKDFSCADDEQAHKKKK
jgi:hypothetical protein